MQKYGFDDARPVLERASARETAARVALAAVAAAFLEQAVGVRLVSHVVAIGTADAPDGTWPGPDDVRRLDDDPVRCFDPDASAAMVAEIDAAHRDGDTLGGVVEVLAYGLPPGLGSYVHWDRRLDSRLAAGLHGHPGDQGCRGGRRLRVRPADGVPGARRDRAGRRRARCGGVRRERAASRAGCRPASRCASERP